MTIQNFEDLGCWQQARNLVNLVYRIENVQNDLNALNEQPSNPSPLNHTCCTRRSDKSYTLPRN